MFSSQLLPSAVKLPSSECVVGCSTWAADKDTYSKIRSNCSTTLGYYNLLLHF